MGYTKKAKIVMTSCFFVLVACFFYWFTHDVYAAKTGGKSAQKSTQVASQKNVGQVQVAGAQAPGAQATGTGIQEHFNKVLAIVKTILAFVKNVIFSIAQKIMKLNYFDPATGSVVSQVQIAETVLKPVGVIFEFSQDVAEKGFGGMIVRPLLGLLPEAISLVKNIFHVDLMPLVDTVLLYPLVPLVEGKVSKDAQTGRLVLKTGPFLEFIFKSALLLSNESQGRLQPGDYDKHLNLLITRLKKTPGFSSIEEIFKKIPKPFQALLEIKVLGKSVKDVLAEFMAQGQEEDVLLGTDEAKIPDVPVLVPEPEDMAQDSVYKELQTLIGSKEMQELGLTPEELKQFEQQMQEVVADPEQDLSVTSTQATKPAQDDIQHGVLGPVQAGPAQKVPAKIMPVQVKPELVVPAELATGQTKEEEATMLSDLAKLLE
ncbi:MAG: hypothetical protein ABH827_05965 [bacterium]